VFFGKLLIVLVLEMTLHEVPHLTCSRLFDLMELPHRMDLILTHVSCIPLVGLISLPFFCEEFLRLLDEYLFPDLLNFDIEASLPEVLVEPAD
jgi:hypothetical protein